MASNIPVICRRLQIEADPTKGRAGSERQFLRYTENAGHPLSTVGLGSRYKREAS